MEDQLKEMPTVTCKKCGYTWLPRQHPSKIRMCPNRGCHTLRWDVEPKPKKEKED